MTLARPITEVSSDHLALETELGIENRIQQDTLGKVRVVPLRRFRVARRGSVLLRSRGDHQADVRRNKCGA